MLSTFTRIALAPAATEPAVDPLRRVPVRFYSEVIHLDEKELSAGYDAGYAGRGCPPQASRAYWHGWRNGRIEADVMPLDEAAKCLRDQASKIEPFRDFPAWAYNGEREENYRRKS